MKNLLLSTLLLAACSGFLCSSEKPNVIIILCDDLGYGDPQCYNPASKILTPHINQLAADGMRFTDAHTPSSVCTPTRYGLMTGRYCWRTWLKSGVLDGFDPPLIQPDRMTVASLLRQNGYHTACIGKWHLGMTWTDKKGQPVEYRGDGRQGHRGDVNADFSQDTIGGPMDCGFNSWFGMSASLDMPPYVYLEGRRPTAIPQTNAPQEKSLWLNQSTGPIAPGFFLNTVLGDFTKRTVSFIESRAQQKEPFFLYLPLNAPHLPVVPAPEWQGKSAAGTYGDFVQELDSRLGEITTALERAKLYDDTLIIFTSDNGGLWHSWKAQESDDIKGSSATQRGKANAAFGHHSNADLRGTKADIWEGGHRVPFIVRWPKHIKPGVVSNSVVELNDIIATLADIIGTPLLQGTAEDSISFYTTITSATGESASRTFAVHHSLTGVFCLREGPWKFVPTRGSGGFSAPKTVEAKMGEATNQLYHLQDDPQESHNVALTHPEIVTRMAKRLAEIQASNSTTTR